MSSELFLDQCCKPDKKIHGEVFCIPSLSISSSVYPYVLLAPLIPTLPLSPLYSFSEVAVRFKQSLKLLTDHTMNIEFN